MNLVADTIDLADYTGHTIPWSVEAEQSVLGGLLLDNHAFDDVRLCLGARHFYNSAHQTIFEAIEALIIASKVADVVTVHARLKQAGKDNETGGLAYLNDLAQSVPSAANARRYAEIVRDRALRRDMLENIGRAQQIAQQSEAADQALDEIATLFSTMERTRSKHEPRKFLDALMDRCEHWNAMEAGEVTPGIPTQLLTMDRALGGGIKPGKVVVLAARPSIGKTSLAGQISLALAHQGHGVLILSQEMPEGELVDRAAANLADISLGAISEGKVSKEDWPRLTDAIEQARDMPLYVDDQPALTLLDIRAKARMVQKRDPLALVVVDYLQLCASASQRDNRHHQIEAISRGLKALAKELGVCVLLLSQINRASTQRDEPSLSDLKESGAIEEDADVVIFLQPKGNLPDGSQLVAAILAKNRQGKRVRVALSFRGATQRWVESTADVSSRANGPPT
ncbi:MAG: replicative DNA helicase [Burkholderiales bacterium]|nr:MAG: replicative DNA helicase [Burkholderiales bacterium]